MLSILIIKGEEPDDADLDAPKIYEPIEAFDQLGARLNMFLAMYNEGIRGAKMDLVFFKVAFFLHLSLSLDLKPLNL
jgi:dynein heavy chain